LRGRSLVPAAQWRRGIAATERIGALLKQWDDRGRASREGLEPPPPRRARPRARPRSNGR
jgi:hypothetical protein